MAAPLVAVLLFCLHHVSDLDRGQVRDAQYVSAARGRECREVVCIACVWRCCLCDMNKQPHA
jgi:hypothetical protein